MSEQETIKKLQEQVKTLRKERDRFERDLHDERRYLQGTPGQPFYVRMRAIVRSCTEHTYEQIRQLRAHLPSPSEVDDLWDTDWAKLRDLVKQLRLLAEEIEDLDERRGTTVNASVVESFPAIEG